MLNDVAVQAPKKTEWQKFFAVYLVFFSRTADKRLQLCMRIVFSFVCVLTTRYLNMDLNAQNPHKGARAGGIVYWYDVSHIVIVYVEEVAERSSWVDVPPFFKQ